jgi:hypothetical protein
MALDCRTPAASQGYRAAEHADLLRTQCRWLAKVDDGNTRGAHTRNTAASTSWALARSAPRPLELRAGVPGRPVPCAVPPGHLTLSAARLPYRLLTHHISPIDTGPLSTPPSTQAQAVPTTRGIITDHLDLLHVPQPIPIRCATDLLLFDERRRGWGPLLVVWQQRDSFDGEDEPQMPFGWPWSATRGTALTRWVSGSRSRYAAAGCCWRCRSPRILVAAD